MASSIKLFKHYYEFLQFFASENIGESVEIDFEKLFAYVSSESCKISVLIRKDTIENDEYYKLIEEDIIAGSPIYDFFILSQWTRDMLKKDCESRSEETELEHDQFKQQYKCYSCKYFREHVASFGTAQKCVNEILVQKHRYERSWFTLRKKCKYFDN